MTKDLSCLDDAALDAEHGRRVDRVAKAKAAYVKHHDDKHGWELLAARQAVAESQREMNVRHGAPPTQTLGA